MPSTVYVSDAIASVSPEKSDLVEVLATDDDKVHQAVLKRLLTEKAGFRLTLIESGEQALDELANRWSAAGETTSTFPTVILMDIMMDPGISGLETVREIRNRYPDALLPIIMLSSLDAEDVICKGIEVGANDYIVKPFKPRDLLRRVQIQMNLLLRIKSRIGQQYEERHKAKPAAITSP